MSEQEVSQPTPDVSDAAGTEKLIHRVHDIDGVKLAVQRIMHEPKLLRLFQSCLDCGGAAWIWGEMGIACATIVDNETDPSFVFVNWFQNTSGYTIKDIVPYFEDWGRENGATRVATAVDREGPWTELTGLSPWKLIIAKEIPNG